MKNGHEKQEHRFLITQDAVKKLNPFCNLQ